MAEMRAGGLAGAGERPGAARPQGAERRGLRPADVRGGGVKGPFAALDLGTNNCRLLIARRVNGSGGAAEFQVIDAFSRIVRLGEGLLQSGRLSDAAMDRAIAALGACAEKLHRRGVTQVRSVATEACRRAENGPEFVRRVYDQTGLALDVITPAEEARLAVLGCQTLIDPKARRTLVFDIGGGSTELVVVGEDGDVASAVSLDIGAVRINERFLPTEPPTQAQQAAARAVIDEKLDGSGTDFASVAAAIGVAGTVTSVAADHLGLREYSRDAVHGTVLTRAVIDEANQRWLGQTTDEIVAHSLMHPLRAAVIGAGSTILAEIVRRVPAGEVLVSETDILDGIAHELLDPVGSP